MTSRATLAALFAFLISVAVFLTGAALMLRIGGGSVMAYLLPGVIALSVFISPVLGWRIASAVQNQTHGR